MQYKVIVTTTYLIDAKHPLLAAKRVRDNKGVVSEQDLYVFGEHGSLKFRENGSTKPYTDQLDSLSEEQLDTAMAGWPDGVF